MKTQLSLMLLLAASVVSIMPANANEMVVKSRQNFPPPQLGIAPPRVEKTIDVSQGKRLDQSLVLYNYNDKPKVIELALHDMDDNKALVKPSNASLSPWTIIHPTTFVIPAKGQQTVRMSIRPPVEFPVGKHYAMLQIKHKIKNPFQMDKTGKSVTVSLGSSYGLPIIVTTK